MIEFDSPEKFIGTTAAIILAASGAATTAGTVYGAKKQSRAATDSAKLQTDAANHAADLQAKAAAEALAFQRQQAEADFQNSEASRRGNYDQWAAAQRRLQTLNDLLGLGPREIPDYVPGKDPNLDTTGAPGGATTPPGTTPPTGQGAGATGVDWTSPNLAAQLSAYFKSRGVADTEVPYWVGKAPELVARGREIGNPNYANERLAAADIFGGAKPTTAPKPTTSPYSGTVGAILAPPYKRQVIAPATPMSGGY